MLAPGVSYEGAQLFASAPFSSFTVVYAKYCDGSGWTADNSSVTQTVNGPVFYRGARLLDALMQRLLQAEGLGSAERVLFSGCSAGAGTLYYHLDYLASLVPASALVLGLGDAMFALDRSKFPGPNVTNHMYDMFSWGFEKWNSSSHVNQGCLAHFEAEPEQAWKCLLGGVSVPFTQTPLFIVNSRYDTWQEVAVLGLNSTDCPGSVSAATGAITLCRPGHEAEQAFWSANAEAMTAALAATPARHGAFFTNCPTHCQTGIGWNYSSSPGGPSLGQAVAQWWLQASEHSSSPGWVAPRFLAAEGDGCTGFSSAAACGGAGW